MSPLCNKVTGVWGEAGQRARALGLKNLEADPLPSPNREAELEHKPKFQPAAQSGRGRGRGIPELRPTATHLPGRGGAGPRRSV